MSKATKRKHVVKEIEDLSIPTQSQSIVRVLESRGNNLHEVENSTGERFLVSMPTKFRRNIWVKRGDFILVVPIEEGDKVKAEIVKILTREHIRFYRAQDCWPERFNDSSKNDQTSKRDSEEIFVNTNRLQNHCNANDSDSDSDSESSDSS